MRQHIFCTEDEKFVLRDWGGYLCFLGTDATVGSKSFGVTAVVRMEQLIHDPHVHGDSDEIFYVLSGQGRQLLRCADGRDVSYDIGPGDTVYLTKNRWHGTSNFSAEKKLDMLLINYYYNGQSDPRIMGVVPAGSVVPTETAYGTSAMVISEETCGVGGIAGEVLTLLPGNCLKSTVKGDEAFLFSISHDLYIRINDAPQAEPLPRHAQAFFFRGEHYCIENRTSEPAQLFYLYTR